MGEGISILRVNRELGKDSSLVKQLMPRDEVWGGGNVYDFHGMWKIIA